MRGGSRLKLGRPNPMKLSKFLRDNRNAPPNHAYVGCTREEKTELPPGFTTISLSKVIEDCPSEAFAAASEAIRSWDVFDPSDTQTIAVDEDKAHQMATLAKSSLLPLWVLQPIAKSYVQDLEHRTASAYHTQKGHFLRGEERLSAAYDPATRQVSLELHSVSSGSGLLGKLLFMLPMSKKMQESFFEAQISRVTEIVEEKRLLATLEEKRVKEVVDEVENKRIVHDVEFNFLPCF